MKDEVRDHRLIDGQAIMTRILTEVSAHVAATGGVQKIGRLVSVSIGGNPDIAIYVRNQARAAQRAGIRFDQQLWSDEVTQEECQQLIAEMNDDPAAARSRSS